MREYTSTKEAPLSACSATEASPWPSHLRLYDAQASSVGRLVIIGALQDAWGAGPSDMIVCTFGRSLRRGHATPKTSRYPSPDLKNTYRMHRHEEAMLVSKTEVSIT